MTQRIAIAQIGMHWTTRENVKSIARALEVAHVQDAAICGFSELAVTGFHRQIAQEAVPEVVGPGDRQLQDHCASLRIGAAVGVPTFGANGQSSSHIFLIDERGAVSATIPKRGLTDPEATFFDGERHARLARCRGCAVRPSFAVKSKTLSRCLRTCHAGAWT